MRVNISVVIPVFCTVVSWLFLNTSRVTMLGRTRYLDRNGVTAKNKFFRFSRLKLNYAFKMCSLEPLHRPESILIRKHRKSTNIYSHPLLFPHVFQNLNPKENSYTSSPEVGIRGNGWSGKSGDITFQNSLQLSGQQHHGVDKLERRNPAVLLNPLLLPIRLLLALLRIILLPLRILLAPLIVLLRILIRFLIVLVQLLNPLFYLVVFFQGFQVVFNIARTILMIISRILRRIFEREHEKDEHEELEIITLYDHKSNRRFDGVTLDASIRELGRKLRLMTHFKSQSKLVLRSIAHNNYLESKDDASAISPVRRGDGCYVSQLDIEFADRIAHLMVNEVLENRKPSLNHLTLSVLSNLTCLDNLDCTRQTVGMKI